MPLVTERLRKQGVPFEVLFHQPTFHARDEAHRLGLPLPEVVKTVLIETEAGHALAVIPSSCRLDMHLVHEVTGDPHARLATEDEILNRFPSYPLGALPPLASELDIPIYVDPEVAARTSVVFATSQCESIKVSTEHVLMGPRTHVVPLTAHPARLNAQAFPGEMEFEETIELEEIAAIADPR